MNIGIFTDCYYPQINGVVTSTMTLKKELEEKGHKVIIFTVNHPDAVEEEDVVRLASIPFLPLKNFRVGAFYSKKAVERIRRMNLDIIHTQTEFSLGIFGRIVAKKLEIPVVHTYHTMYEDYVHYVAVRPIVRPATKLAKKGSAFYCKYCNGVIVPTTKVKDKLEEYGLIDKGINIIPTGTDIEPFKKENYLQSEIIELRKEFGFQKDDKVVLFLGRIAKEKSIDTIIKAMPDLIKKTPNAKMLVVGDGPEREHLEKLAKELNIKEKVMFAGEKPWKDIGKYYQLGDVFVSASVTETQGLTFTEAMAGEIPVVAKYDKNLEEIIYHGVNGFIFNRDEELSEVLYKILTDEEATKKVVGRAYEEIEPLSSKHFGTEVLKVYERTIQEYCNIKFSQSV